MKTYGTQEVLALSGISFRQLDYWVRTGAIRVPKPRPGSGIRRHYTYEQTLRVLAVATLVKAGVSNQLAVTKFASYEMHPEMTELVYQDGPVSITLDMRTLIGQLEQHDV